MMGLTMKTLFPFALLLPLALLLASCASPGAYVTHDSRSERFDLSPLASVDFSIPEDAVSWRVAGNPTRSASPFTAETWFSLLDADGRGVEFVAGDELAPKRLEALSTAGALTLRVDNAGGTPVTGSVVWELEKVSEGE